MIVAAVHLAVGQRVNDRPNVIGRDVDVDIVARVWRAAAGEIGEAAATYMQQFGRVSLAKAGQYGRPKRAGER